MKKEKISLRYIIALIFAILLLGAIIITWNPVKEENAEEPVSQVIESAPAQITQKQYKKETVYTTTSVRMRAGASLNAKIIKVLKINTKLTKIGTEGKWTKILEGDKEYFVYSKYLSKNKTEIKKVQNKKKTTTTSKIKVQKATKGNKKIYQDYAHNLVINKYKWTEKDFDALVILWKKESNWNPKARNKYTGAYGIPQALPGSKMKSAGSDWKTNYKTQIKWGLKYIKKRYGSPSKAYGHFKKTGWY